MQEMTEELRRKSENVDLKRNMKKAKEINENT